MYKCEKRIKKQFLQKVLEIEHEHEVDQVEQDDVEEVQEVSLPISHEQLQLEVQLVYTLNFTMYTTLYTVYTLYTKLYNVYYTLHCVHTKLYYIYYTLHCVHTVH